MYSIDFHPYSKHADPATAVVCNYARKFDPDGSNAEPHELEVPKPTARQINPA
jgi:hypothetical protein